MINMMNSGSGWMMGGMWILFILFWILVIAAVVLLVRWLVERNRPSSTSESPLELLEKGYARGEIDRETFERMRRDIERKAS